MSLIDEALRKVRDPLAPKAPAGKPEPASTSQAAAGSPLVHSWSAETPTAAAMVAAPAQKNSAAFSLVTGAIGVLSAALLIGGGLWLGRNWHGAKSVAPAAAPAPAPVVVPPEPAAPAPAPPIVEFEPAEPPPPPPETKLSLTGLAEGPGASYAMINGSIVEIGDQVAEFTLIEISKGSVRLRKRDGSETILRVPR